MTYKFNTLHECVLCYIHKLEKLILHVQFKSNLLLIIVCSYTNHHICY